MPNSDVHLYPLGRERISLRKLLNTGEREVNVVEDDRVWGNRPGNSEKPREMGGKKLLGKALIGTRTTIVEYERLDVC